MNLYEVIDEAFKKNAIVKTSFLSDEEFLLVCNGKARWEDGCLLGGKHATLSIIESLAIPASAEWKIARVLTEDEVAQFKRLELSPMSDLSSWWAGKIAQVLND